MWKSSRWGGKKLNQAVDSAAGPVGKASGILDEDGAPRKKTGLRNDYRQFSPATAVGRARLGCLTTSETHRGQAQAAPMGRPVGLGRESGEQHQRCESWLRRNAIGPQALGLGADWLHIRVNGALPCLLCLREGEAARCWISPCGICAGQPVEPPGRQARFERERGRDRSSHF